MLSHGESWRRGTARCRCLGASGPNRAELQITADPAILSLRAERKPESPGRHSASTLIG